MDTAEEMSAQSFETAQQIPLENSSTDHWAGSWRQEKYHWEKSEVIIKIWEIWISYNSAEEQKRESTDILRPEDQSSGYYLMMRN